MYQFVRQLSAQCDKSPRQKAEALVGLLRWLDYECPAAEKEAAFARLARQLGKTVAEVKAIKESTDDHTPMGQKNLVWHEEVDCETLYLVPQEIHGNISHFGGIAMCQLLRKHELI